MVFKATSYMFFESPESISPEVNELVYGNIPLPDIIVYKGPMGAVHLSGRCEQGSPVKVRYQDVVVDNLCYRCEQSSAYNTIERLENFLLPIVSEVGAVKYTEKAFESYKNGGTEKFFILGNLLSMCEHAAEKLRPKGYSFEELGSFPDDFLPQITALKTEIETFLRTDSSRAIIEQEIRQNYFRLLDEGSATIFDWESLNGIERIAAVAYGIDAGGGRGFVTAPCAVSIVAHSRGSAVAIPGGSAVPPEVLEVAAGLWDPENTQSLFATGDNLLKAAEILAGVTPS